MSKIDVKRTLATFDAQQLRELVLQLYDKSKDTKALLDFYANPNIKAKLEEFKHLISEEITRFHRHHPAPRMSQVKAIVKKFTYYEVGDENVAELMWHAVQEFATIEGAWLPEALLVSINKYFKAFLDYIEKRNMTQDYLLRILKFVREPDDVWDDSVMYGYFETLEDQGLL